jgi:glycosyltransferase involved in cell wall biosynthesis
LGNLDPETKARARRNHAEAIERALQKFSIDIIHFHGIDFVHYLPPPGVPAVVTLHLPPAWYEGGVFDLRRPDTYLVCVSESQRRACPINANIAAMIPNGISSEPETSKGRKGNYALSMGRICPEKAFHLAMDAAAKVGLPLFLAGQVFGYPEHLKYFDEYISPRLKSDHKFLGPVSGHGKKALLAGARCLLISSRAQETSSLVAMEAFAAGTPVVAFPSGALPEVVEQARTGFLVNSVDEMAAAIEKVEMLDPAACIRAAKTRFSAECMSTQYMEFYEAVACGKMRTNACEVLS